MSERGAKLYLADIENALGEAVRNIPSEVTAMHPDIPWGEMISMRNKVIHEYFGVDDEILWKTIKEDLPIFREQIAKIASE